MQLVVQLAASVHVLLASRPALHCSAAEIHRAGHGCHSGTAFQSLGGSLPLISLRNPSHALPPCPQRVELGVLDAVGSGALSPSQLLAWLERRAPLAACCEALVSETEWCTAVAARLLLLHGRRGRVLVREMLASPEVMELALALHAWDAADAAMQAAAAAAAAEVEDGGSGSAGAAGAAAAPQAAQLAAALGAQQGWFAPAAVAALRSRFAELDADGDGLLTQDDFST